jgi:hypothetical protein
MTSDDIRLLIPKWGKIEFWRTARHQAWNDLKTRWRRGLFWAICILVYSGLLHELLGMNVFASKPYFLGEVPSAIRGPEARNCYPDGTFTLFPDKYNYWDVSRFFQITIAFGQLTFAQAKVIDVAWDVVGTLSLLYFANHHR